MFECRFEQLGVDEFIANPLLTGFQIAWSQTCRIVRQVVAYREIVRLAPLNPIGNQSPGRPPPTDRHEKESKKRNSLSCQYFRILIRLVLISEDVNGGLVGDGLVGDSLVGDIVELFLTLQAKLQNQTP
jgi:hypothetical protein